MVIPDTLYTQVFARSEFWQVADNGDQTVKAKAREMLATAHFRTQAQHGVPVLRIVEGDAFNRTGEIIHWGKYTRRVAKMMIG